MRVLCNLFCMAARNGRSVTKKDHLSPEQCAQFHLNKLNYKILSQLCSNK